jgi:hypothetical protein
MHAQAKQSARTRRSSWRWRCSSPQSQLQQLQQLQQSRQQLQLLTRASKTERAHAAQQLALAMQLAAEAAACFAAAGAGGEEGKHAAATLLAQARKDCEQARAEERLAAVLNLLALLVLYWYKSTRKQAQAEERLAAVLNLLALLVQKCLLYCCKKYSRAGASGGAVGGGTQFACFTGGLLVQKYKY